MLGVVETQGELSAQLREEVEAVVLVQSYDQLAVASRLEFVLEISFELAAYIVITIELAIDLHSSQSTVSDRIRLNVYTTACRCSSASCKG